MARGAAALAWHAAATVQGHRRCLVLSVPALDSCPAHSAPVPYDVASRPRAADAHVAGKHENWQKLFRRNFGFFDQRLTICPPIKCVKLAFPKNGPPRVTVIAGGVQPGGSLLSPAEITLSAGGQCTTGSMTLRQKGKRGAVFP